MTKNAAHPKMLENMSEALLLMPGNMAAILNAIDINTRLYVWFLV
jgi:hypothetical protein